MSKKRKHNSAKPAEADPKSESSTGEAEGVAAESDTSTGEVAPTGVRKQKVLLIVAAALLSAWIAYLGYVAWVVNQ
ncbi:MAG: hypothetical protein AAF456_13095 [Planctomycetota bacterium]